MSETIEFIKAAAILLIFIGIGIELRHEIQHGVLRNAKNAIVPILAAIGGMALPVAIYSVINFGKPTAIGWGVPMSTDVAFALAILAFAGKFLPKAIRTFVLSVAVVDDSLTILMIAIFYASSFHVLSLASLGGVVIGLFMPKGDAALKKLQPLISFAALPVFAVLSIFVHQGTINTESFFASPITLGVVAAIVFGKPIGVLGTTYLVTKSGLGKLSDQIKWADLIPTGLLFGICFTVSLLMSEIVFGQNPNAHTTANLAVFTGSAISAVLATIALSIRKRAHVK